MQIQWIKQLLVGLLMICLMGLASYQLLFSVDKEASLEQTVEKLNKRNAADPIQLSSYAKNLGVKLQSPTVEELAVNAQLQVAGSIEKKDQLSTPYVWMQVDYLGEDQSSFHYYVPLEGKEFSKKIQLFAGEGDYQVTLRMPSDRDRDQFYSITSFQVKNVNPTVQKDIEYSMNAIHHGLTISNPNTGLQKANQVFQLQGTTKEKKDGKLLIQMKKGEQVWKRTIVTRQGTFQESVPLLFGKGTHEIQLMVPSEGKEGYFQEGATFYLHNQSDQSVQPIRYTHLYNERGIQLTTPLTSGGHADHTYRIAGQIDEEAPYAKQTSHVIVQTEKEGKKATYFLPVDNYQFDDSIYLRFGGGTYEVTVFVPDFENKNQDYFRFFNVASFKVTSSAKQDQRNLLPSRGIQPYHPRIQNLAKRVTAGEETTRGKAKAIYRYVSKTMTYDMQKLQNNSFAWDDRAIKSLDTGTGVCQDYVFLALSMLRSLEIPSRFVEGEAGNQRHAWIEFLDGDQWVTMDPTWGSGYINGNQEFVKRYDERYFDPGQSFFRNTHKRTGVVY